MRLRPRRLPTAVKAAALMGASALLASLALVGVLVPSPAAALSDPAAPVFINELHYDNAGTDADEFVEVAGPAGTDLTGWSLVLYNGNGGAEYGSFTLSATIDDEGSGFGAVSLSTAGLQNGAPDGVALVDDGGTLVEFLSYEGTFTAVGGPADGVGSTDIGEEEGSSTPIGSSLQRAGSGTLGGDFAWQPEAPASPGTINTGQTFGGSGPVDVLFISELHYDNDGADVGEFVEVAGPAGTDLTGWSLVPYNGNGGAQYSVTALSGAIDDEGAGSGAVSFSISGLQNGAPDGVALVDDGGAVVEFLSYEGIFDATDGPAAGLTSTDIGVSESSSTAIGDSLQLLPPDPDTGTWQGPLPNTEGSLLGGGGPGAGLPLPFSENFDTDCVANGWQIVSVDTDTANTWTCSTAFSNADANGFGDAAPADEWLITPALDLDAQTDEVLEFRSYTAFTDSGIAYPQLEVVYSTDYDGAGDPTTATWTALTGITFSPEDSSSFTDSGAVDLSAITGSTVRFAFHYRSSGTAAGTAANWRIDQVEFTVGGGGGDPVPALIHDVQGDGATSPLEDTPVIIDGIVVGDFQEVVTGDPTDESLGGFFVQEEDADADANPATSEGIFVFAPGGTDVSVGDAVEVTGTVQEFNELTEISAVTSVVVHSSGNPLPTPATPTVPTAAGDPAVDWEAIEGMSVMFTQPLYATDLFPLGAFGEVGLSAIGPWDHPNQVEAFGSPEAAALRELNLASRVILDDGEAENEAFPNSTWNPTPTPYLDGAEGTLRAGDRVDDLLGVVHHSFEEFEVHPINVADPTDPDGAVSITRFPRPASVPDVGGDLQVASFNVLNYFVTIDTGGAQCGPPGFEQGCRGADTTEEFTLQSAKIADAIAALDADIVGLIELENSGTDAAIADLVAKVNALSARTYDYVPTGFIGTDAITVGLIYDPATVGRAGDFTTLDSSDSPAFIDDSNRPALAQTFTEVASGETVTVAVNHLKSKGSACDAVANPGDPTYGVDPYGAGDDVEMAFEGNCNLTRTAAARVLGQWLAGDPTGTPSDNLLILGDLNAYANEDPITELEGQGYTDLKESFTGSNAWADGGHSYVFDGEFGTLDYGMANPALTGLVSGAAAWHLNADEPFAIDYQNFNPPGQASPDRWKSSDHDPLLIGLDLGGGVLSCNGLEATIVGDDTDETIHGTSGDDVIVALGGDDRIFGGGGDDVICAGEGDDRVYAASGDDTIFGEAGDDILFGQAGNDTISGGDGDDHLYGQGGADTLAGEGGDDILEGGADADDLSGGAGDDKLRGRAGDDTLDGGPEVDVLHGHRGTDTCINGEFLSSCEL